MVMSSYCSLVPSSYKVDWDLFDHTWFNGEESSYVLTVKETDEKPKRTAISVERYKPPVSYFPIPFLSKVWGPQTIVKEWSKAAQVINNYFLEDDGNLFKEIASKTSDLDLFEEYCSNFVSNCVLFNREYIGRLNGAILKGIKTDVLIGGTDFDKAEKLLDTINKTRKVGDKIYLISHRSLLKQLDYAERNLHTLTELSQEEKKSDES